MLLFVQTYQILREKIQREREREIIYFGKMDSQINGNNNNKNNNNFQPYQQSAIGYTSRCLLGHLPGSLTGSAFWTINFHWFRHLHVIFCLYIRFSLCNVLWKQYMVGGLYYIVL